MKSLKSEVNEKLMDATAASHGKVCIVIPVKNEEEYITKCLAAFLDQIDQTGNPIDRKIFEILILANNCTDKSCSLIQKFKLKNPSLTIDLKQITLEKHQANIGFVRKSLMDIAYSRLQKNGGGIIMTTDADTIVSNDWIYHNIHEINKGADAVGGRILFKEEEMQDLDFTTLSLHEKDEKYQLLVAELKSVILENFDFQQISHHQHFNGSFAVTTECYQKSGGIPDVLHLEDCAFYEQLLRIDANVRHSNNVKVYTSARYIGRTEIGLSYQLNIWRNMDPENSHFLVESCESLVQRYTTKKKLLHLWKQRPINNFLLIEKLKGIDENMIIDEEIIVAFSSSTYFGEWFQVVKNLNEKHWKENFAPAPIDTEIRTLEHCITTYST